MIRGPAPKLLVAVLVVQLIVGGALIFLAANDFDLNGEEDSASAARSVPAAKTKRFDERRAFALLRRQVERYGHRPAGSPALRRLAEDLRRRLPRGRFEPIPGHPGLRNVVGSLPGRGKAIVIGAHYDVEAEPRGFVGANDGAAGTAAVVELAQTMRRARRPRSAPPLRFVLFDGEEEPAGCDDGDFQDCALRGSKAYVKAHRREVRAMVLLDYVANKNLRIPQEGSSDDGLWRRLRASARRVGVARVFPDRTQTAIIDDHTPFLEEGIPAIDLIDFSYRYRDTLRDTVDKTSARSLDAVGETVADLLLHWTR
jgi:hypothetical protein